jgi:hypothetical protein
MRKFALCGFLSLALVSVCLAGFEPDNLELRFGLGPAWWCGGDFNKALQGGNDYNKDELPYLEGTYKPLGLGYNLSAEAVYWLNPRMGVGLNIGAAGAPVADYSIVGASEGIETVLGYRASALAVKPAFHYGFPLCENSFLDFFLGPAFYFGCFQFSKQIDIDSGYESDFEFKGRTSALGLHGGLGVDYKLNEKFSLYGAVSMDLTSLGNLKDEWTSEVRTPSGTFNQSGTGTLWVYDYQPNGTAYRFWGFGSKPSGPGISNAKEGSIGGPAFGFTFGMKYKF